MPHLLPILEPPGQRATHSQAQAYGYWERMQRFGAELQAQELLLASQSWAWHASAARCRRAAGARR
ncbi:hypothetical protein [Azohydromonas australica]|uniref:hypothetical protein n=1 Tax=Azohydromonas australica TaxID=364039 RepID=UPI0004062BF8